MTERLLEPFDTYLSTLGIPSVGNLLQSQSNLNMVDCTISGVNFWILVSLSTNC